MKKLFILLILFSCNTTKQLERSVAKVEKYKKILGVKPCECPQTVNYWPLGGTTCPLIQEVPDLRPTPYWMGEGHFLVDTAISSIIGNGVITYDTADIEKNSFKIQTEIAKRNGWFPPVYDSVTKRTTYYY